jgi:hypothetical protein
MIGGMNSPFLPPTDQRVPAHTSALSNQRIQARTLHGIARYCGADDQALTRRIHELEREWDVERTIEAHAGTLSLLGLVLGVTLDRRFLALPFAVSAFLVMHALEGMYPPLPVIRRLGIRTSDEIHREILALRILRGDFIDRPVYPESLLAAATR